MGPTNGVEKKQQPNNDVVKMSVAIILESRELYSQVMARRTDKKEHGPGYFSILGRDARRKSSKWVSSDFEDLEYGNNNFKKRT